MYVILNLVVNNKEVKESLISRLGKYTFGMYLYHPTIIIFTKIGFDILHLKYQNGGWVYFLVGVISFLVTIFISIVSYEFFEKKILRFKTYFSQTPTRV
jgi:peptidoglycan/LPS O-acetylase OafA/YrhL